MKKYCLAVIISLSLNSLIYSNDYIRFFWSIGDIGIGWDTMANKPDPIFFLNVGNFNWVTPFGLGWGFHLFDATATYDYQQTIILPVEVNFSPFGDRDSFLFFTLYGRGGLLPGFDYGEGESFFSKSSFWGAAGLRAAWFPTIGNSWSIYLGGFVEYTTRNELRVGLSVDLTIIALYWLYSASEPSSSKDKKK